MTELTQRKVEANRQNAKLGGVKTDEGKAISRYNALKHGILSDMITEYDTKTYETLHFELISQYDPQTFVEEILVERITIIYVRLNRIAKAEKEYIMKVLNPRVVVYDLADTLNEVVNDGGYLPKIDINAIESLERVYGRYETSLENRIYKAIHELERIQRLRQGEAVPPPLAVDINVDMENKDG